MEAGGALADRERRVIDLTEAELIAANLEAMGLEPDAVATKTKDDEVFDGLVHLMKECGRSVSSVELARFLKIPQATVHKILSRLADSGRMIRAYNRESGRPCFVPNVVGRKE